MIRDLYTVQLTPEQVARACEEYVLRKTGQSVIIFETLSAKTDVTGIKPVIVRVSEKRRPRDKATEAKQAGERG